MPKPGNKLKRANSFSGRGIDLYNGLDGMGRPVPTGEQRRNSVQALPRSVSNEANMPGSQEPHGENVRQDVGNIRDHNGPAPINNEQNNLINNNIIGENVGGGIPPVPAPNQVGNGIPPVPAPNQVGNGIPPVPVPNQGDNENPQQAGDFRFDDFVPQRKQVEKWSKASKAGHFIARGTGVVAGAALAPVMSSVGIPYNIFTSIATEQTANAKDTQKFRHHDLVPGRDGETFAQNPGEGDILEDFRRVPTVWSYLTAARAVDARGRDIDPKITVYIEQPIPGSTKSAAGNNGLGHTMLGIEYTRASKITGRKERYNIKYGYYPAGGMTRSVDAMMTRGALIPGQLVNDEMHKYDISKTYTVSRKQAVAIAEASEKYTEQGGYGYYTRNCTAFVRDMLRVGGLPEETVNSIFKEHQVQFDAEANLGFFATNAINPILDANVQRKFKELMKSDDKSYQGMGNKRVTKQDFDIYTKTKNTNGLRIVKSLSSAAAGEDMRRMTDPEGQLGSYRYISERHRKSPGQTAETVRFAGIYAFNSIAREIERAAWALRKKLDEQVLTAAQMGQIERNDAFAQWYGFHMPGVGTAIDELGDKGEQIKRRTGMTDEQAKTADIADYITPDEVKNAYEITLKEMNQISTFYQTIFGSDSRINTEVMNLLSTMQIGVTELNETYQRQRKASDEGDIGTLREKMILGKYKIRSGNMEVEMSPTHYESYLQIYKEPEVAIRSYKKFMELDEEKKAGRDKKWSKKKSAEWKVVSRNEGLARQLDQSHREILNQNSFAQSDIDYAFRLRRMEISQAAAGEMYENNMTASMTYMALFFDKLYKGIQEGANQNLSDPVQPEELVLWLNNYLTRKTNDKARGTEMILRGILRAYQRPTSELIKDSFHTLLMKSYLRKAFPIGGHKTDKIDQVGYALEPIYEEIMTRNLSFTRLIDRLAANVMTENRQPRR